jgi:hypothetical protein
MLCPASPAAPGRSANQPPRGGYRMDVAFDPQPVGIDCLDLVKVVVADVSELLNVLGDRTPLLVQQVDPRAILIGCGRP